jgi:hypothetical protein
LGGIAGGFTADSSFLELLVSMTNATGEISYRQELTDRLVRLGFALGELDRNLTRYAYWAAVPVADGVASRVSTEDAGDAEALISNGLDRLTTEVQAAIEDVSVIYAQLSWHALNPEASLYRATSPLSVRVEYPISRFRAAFAGLIVMVLFAMFAPLGCLLDEYRRRKLAAGQRGAADDRPGAQRPPDGGSSA